MEKKVTSTLMLIIVLVSLMYPAMVDLVVKAKDSDGASVDSGATGGTADWCMFRHDANHTAYVNSTVQTPLWQLWNATTNGPSNSSPAIINGTVLAGSNDNQVYVFNATDGSRITGVGYNLTTEGAVESSPAAVDNKVFAGCDDGRVYAWNMATFPGPISLRWSYATDGPVTSSPTVANGIVFIGSDDCYIYALNETTTNPGGQLKWKYRTACPVYSSPAFCDNRVFVSTSDGRLYALNLTGRCEWFKDIGANSSSPAVADRKVFVGATNGTVYAFDENTGDIQWSNSTGGPVYSSPAVADGIVFVGSCDNNIYAFNETTGNPIWNHTTGGPVYSSPAVAISNVQIGPCIYVDSNGTVYAFAAENKAPQPTISCYPTQQYILQSVTFNGANSTDPDGSINNCTWDFGDGSVRKNLPWTTAYEIVSHSYLAAGVYNVTLTVTDNYPIQNLRKTSGCSQNVTVQEAWPMYHHDPSHSGNSTSLAPIANKTLWTLPDIGADGWRSPSDVEMYPSPAVIGNVVYVCSANGTVYAVNATTGNITWTVRPVISGGIHSSPAVCGDMIFFGSDDYHVYALNASNNGTTVWTWPNSTTTLDAFYSSPTVWNGLIFVGCRDKNVYVLNSTTGALVRYYATTGQVRSSPAVADSWVFFGSADDNVYAYDASGTTPERTYVTTGPVYSSPAVADGMVFVGSYDNNIYAFNETTGNPIWNHTTGDPVYASPAVADGMVFVGSDDGYIYAFDERTGNPIWNYTTGGFVRSSPAVADGRVFFGSNDEQVYAFTENGTFVWSYSTGSAVYSSPSILNGTLYVASNGTLYAFQSQFHDVAVTGVAASPNRLAENDTATITIVLKNRGTFNESNVNVTAQCDDVVFNSTLIDLTQAEEMSVQFLWNTTNVPTGDHTIRGNATLADSLVDADLSNNFGTCQVEITSGIHDVGITEAIFNLANSSVPVPPNIANRGFNVTVQNNGGFVENVTVTAYWSNSTYTGPQPIGNVTILELDINTSQTVTIPWNTTSFAKSNYTISVYAWPAKGDINTTDNNFTLGVIFVSIAGDVTGPNGVPDGQVNLMDVYRVAMEFGSSTPTWDPYWGPVCDINNDRTVNLVDYYKVCMNFGQGP